MELAKPHLDIGLFTNDISQQRTFWGSKAALRLDHELEMGPGWVQHRYDAHGSVIKVNHRTTTLPELPRSGFTGLAIAQEGRRRAWRTEHPDGDAVKLVVPGHDHIEKIGITISSTDIGNLLDFYRDVLGFEQLALNRLRCGDSVVSFVEGRGGSDVVDFAGPGFRYITMQVFDADREMKEVAAQGGRIVREAVNFAGVARYGFVADPDGNWIEISARTSLTGIAVS